MKGEYIIGIDVYDVEHIFKMNSFGTIECHNNKLLNLDLSNCPNLKHLCCHDNQLNILDLSNCKNIKEIYCHSNKFINLDVSNCPNLYNLGCDNIDLIGE